MKGFYIFLISPATKKFIDGSAHAPLLIKIQSPNMLPFD
jgi:hypothetical protein